MLQLTAVKYVNYIAFLAFWISGTLITSSTMYGALKIKVLMYCLHFIMFRGASIAPSAWSF